MAEKDDALLSFHDAYEIAEKIVEMADRLKGVSKIMPGSRAKWVIDIDADRFDIVMTMRKKEKADE